MKRKIALILILIISIFIWIFLKILPDIFLNSGKAFYQQKKYVEAQKVLKKALKLNPENKDTRYYLVQTLIKLPPTLEVQKELFDLSQANLPDSADLIADKQISYWRNQIAQKSGENYIEQVPFDNKILRWDVNKFPLKISVENTSNKAIPAYYESTLKKAFLQWQASTNNFIKVKFVNKDESPDIVVKIISQDNNKCQEAGCKYVVAYTTPTIKNNLLKKMEIVFYDSNNLGQAFGEREIYNTALHEIGHAFGIMGHSYNKDDLMYMENNLSEDYDAFRSDFQLISPVDMNTLVLLYRLIPDITNTPLSEFDTSRQFYAPIVMGSDEQINSRKMLEAKNYIEAAPNLPNGYIDLAAAYAEQREFNSAIESLQKALDLSSSDDEKFIVYYNFAVVYMEIQDWDNALKYAGIAKQLKQSEDIDGLIAGINFNKGNKNFAKNSYVESLEKNPGNIIDAVNLAKIYLRELNLVQAGKILNDLIKANPDAKNDSRVKSFGLLMFFFK